MALTELVVDVLELAQVQSALAAVEMQHAVERCEQPHVVDSEHFQAALQLRNRQQLGFVFGLTAVRNLRVFVAEQLGVFD